MGDILRKIQELLENGGEYEQSRSTGIIISSKVNWFDAVLGEDDGSRVTGVPSKAGSYTEDRKKRISQKKSDISDIP
jgi:hypothetical protein